MSEDRFFERLRADAGALRYEPDAVALARIRARIREDVARPTVVQLIAAWFRPLAATLTAVALAAAIGAAVLDDTGDTGNTLGDANVEISMAGDTYRVLD